VFQFELQDRLASSADSDGAVMLLWHVFCTCKYRSVQEFVDLTVAFRAVKDKHSKEELDELWAYITALASAMHIHGLKLRYYH
jgi:hypothetical protein